MWGKRARIIAAVGPDERRHLRLEARAAAAVAAGSPRRSSSRSPSAVIDRRTASTQRRTLP